MKILVTGMTASQTREDDSMAGNIAKFLREKGHEVEVKRPSLAGALDGEQWDHVFVGLGPLHGIGTANMYGALATIGTHWPAKCSFFLDDVDSGKIGSGLRIMRKNPWKLTKPFYQYKREFDRASHPEVHDWLIQVILAMLDGGESTYPVTVIPSFTFDNAFEIGARISLSAAVHAQVIDFSCAMPTLDSMLEPFTEKYGSHFETPKGAWWAVEQPPLSRPVRTLGPFKWELMHVETAELPALEQCAGYLAPTAHWSPRFIQMTGADIPVVSPWRVFSEHIGTSFEHLASEIETWTPARRKKLARKQFQELVNVIPSEIQVADQLNLIATGEGAKT